MVCCESPNAPFSFLRTRFCEGMMQFAKLKRLLPRVLQCWREQNDFGKSGGGGVGTLEYVLIENHHRRWILLRVYTLPIIIAVNTWESKCI